MHDLDPGFEQNLPASLLEAQAPIQILEVHEVAFIHRANPAQCIAPHQHEGPGDGFDPYRLVRQGLADVQVVLEARIFITQPAQTAQPNKGSPRGRNAAPATRLFRTIGIPDQTASHPHVGIRVEKRQHPGQRIGR